MGCIPETWWIYSQDLGIISSVVPVYKFFSSKKKIWSWKKKRHFLWPLTFCLQLNKNQPVTVHDVLQILRRHVSVPQCDVFGYLTIDHELVVLFAPVDQRPTPMQVTHTQSDPLNIKMHVDIFPILSLCVLLFDSSVNRSSFMLWIFFYLFFFFCTHT